jgi:AraC-like DNA-binding protein
MYILGFMAFPGRTTRGTSLDYQSTVVSPVGGVTLAGFIRDSAGVPADPMRVFGQYALVYLVEGAGRYADANGVRLDVSPGDLLTVFPDLPHTYGPGPGQRWSEFYVAFVGPVFDLWRRQGLLDPARPRRRLEPIDYWLRQLERVIEPADGLSRACRVQQFLADTIEHTRQLTTASHETAWLADARRLLTPTEDSPPPRPEAVAEMLGMSYEVFRKKFAQFAGVPPAKFRDAGLIDLATRLLHDRALPLKQIARRCGFYDEFHFSRRFKQKVGLSPSEFRERLPT